MLRIVDLPAMPFGVVNEKLLNLGVELIQRHDTLRSTQTDHAEPIWYWHNTQNGRKTPLYPVSDIKRINMNQVRSWCRALHVVDTDVFGFYSVDDHIEILEEQGVEVGQDSD